MEHNSEPFPVNDIFKYKMFKKVKYKNLTFHAWQYRNADCYCYIKGKKILQIHNILLRCHDNILFFYGKQFLSYFPYYVYPYNSEFIDIFRVTDLANEFLMVQFQDVIAKCMVLPDKNNFWISFSLVHQIE